MNPRDVESRIAQLRHAGYTLVVEGAGGVMVPLAWDYTVLDLARACELEAIVVARPGLGTLNHVAMTVTVLRAREIAVRGVVLNGRSATPDLAESTNPGCAGPHAARHPRRRNPTQVFRQPRQRGCGAGRSPPRLERFPKVRLKPDTDATRASDSVFPFRVIPACDVRPLKLDATARYG